MRRDDMEFADEGQRNVAMGDEIRAALDQLRAGNKCQECHWQDATTVVRRRYLMCRTCATVDLQMRAIDATAARLHRRQNRSAE